VLWWKWSGQWRWYREWSAFIFPYQEVSVWFWKVNICFCLCNNQRRSEFHLVSGSHLQPNSKYNWILSERIRWWLNHFEVRLILITPIAPNALCWVTFSLCSNNYSFFCVRVGKVRGWETYYTLITECCHRLLMPWSKPFFLNDPITMRHQHWFSCKALSHGTRSHRGFVTVQVFCSSPLFKWPYWQETYLAAFVIRSESCSRSYKNESMCNWLILKILFSSLKPSQQCGICLLNRIAVADPSWIKEFRTACSYAHNYIHHKRHVNEFYLLIYHQNNSYTVIYSCYCILNTVYQFWLVNFLLL
jgi:hypothetical protein